MSQSRSGAVFTIFGLFIWQTTYMERQQVDYEPEERYSERTWETVTLQLVEALTTLGVSAEEIEASHVQWLDIYPEPIVAAIGRLHTGGQ